MGVDYIAFPPPPGGCKKCCPSLGGQTGKGATPVMKGGGSAQGGGEEGAGGFYPGFQTAPLSMGGPLGPDPGTDIGVAGTASTTLRINGNPDFASNYTTKAECIQLPLKDGTMLPLQWMLHYAVLSGLNDRFRPAGGLNTLFSFYPQAQMGAVDTSETYHAGEDQYNSLNGPPVAALPRNLTTGTTYYTTFDERLGTYFEYWINPGGGGGDRINRQYDTHGKEIDYPGSYVNIFNGNKLVPMALAGNAIGRVVPYFAYSGTTQNSGCWTLSTLYLADLDVPSNSRTIYFTYANPTTDPGLQQITYPNGCTVGYHLVDTANAIFQIKCEIDAEGYTTYFEYQTGQPTNTPSVSKTVEPEGRITYYTYPLTLSTGTVMGFLGRQPTYFNWIQSQTQLPMTTQQIDPLGFGTFWGYDATLDRVIQRLEANGDVTYFGYVGGTAANQYALAWMVRAADQATTYYGYGTTYDLTTTVAPRNASGYSVVTYYEYNTTRDRTAMVDALGNRTGNQFDSVGRNIAVQDARRNTTYYNYGQATGHVDSVAMPDGSTTYYGYNSFRDKLEEVSPRWPEQSYAAFTTYYQYDQLSRLIQTTDPLGNITYYDYTARSLLMDRVDALGVDTAYTYNGLKLMTQETVTTLSGQQLTQTKHGYDIYKNRVKTLDPNGNPTYFFYDVIDRLVCTQDALSDLTYYSYDAVRNRTTLTDARNNTTYYFYDTLSHRTVDRDALGDASYYFYDLADNRTCAVNALGNPTYFFYDPVDRVQATRDALANPTYFFYDAVSNRTTVMDARFNSTYYQFDSRNRRTAMQDALGNVTYYTFDRASNLTQLLDARQNATLTFYDVLDRRSSLVDAAGNPTYYFYDAVSNRTQVRDPRGNASYFFYDGLHRTTGMRDALGDSTYYAYDAASNMTTLMDARSNTTYFIYDKLNRRTNVVDALNNATYFFYDPVSNRTVVEDPLFHSTYFGYDAINRLTRVMDALAGTTYFAFDRVSNLTAVIDPDNHATYFQYDADNRPSAIRMPDTGSAYFFYDSVSNRTKTVDPRGNATYFAFDAVNRLTQMADALFRTLYFQYDAVSNLSKYVDAEGGSSAYTYDAINRRTNAAYTAAGADISDSLLSNPYYIYDQSSNLVQVGDLWGLHLMGYDAVNRLSQHQFPQGSVVYFRYDPVSSITAKVYPGTSGTAGAAYDALNRQIRVQAPSGATAYFSYDAASNLTQKLFGNSMKLVATYDNAERVSKWRNADKNGGSLTYFDYTRDAKGLIVKSFREATNTVYYSYDVNDRLLSETWLAQGKHGLVEVYGYRYAYDVAGNRTKALINGSTTYYFYDQANQLKVTGTTSAFATPTYYLYDKNGSVTNIVPSSGAATYFAYNTAGLVARIKWQDASSTYFYYDGNVGRYAMVAAGQTAATYFLWDGPNLLQEQNADGTVKEEHTNMKTPIAGIGQLVETNRPGQTQQKLYPVMDPRGSITKYIQSDGATVFAAREYDSFGNLIPNSSTGNWPGRFGYQGQTWQEIFSANGSQRILLSPTRLYDPVTGRFLQFDPLAFGNPNGAGIFEVGPLVPGKSLVKNFWQLLVEYASKPTNEIDFSIRESNAILKASRDVDGLRRTKNSIYNYVLNHPVSMIDPTGLDCPGCDLPDFFKSYIEATSCGLKSCAKHDKCYHDNRCTAASWFGTIGLTMLLGGSLGTLTGLGATRLISGCAKCNIDVALSLAACELGSSGPDNAKYYCATSGEYITIGGPPGRNNYCDIGSARRACCTPDKSASSGAPRDCNCSS